ncbi:hypothetical protein COCC4DRAFT_30305 [Bipolaris maydis ATCC 48331]|uniref:Uncharacterized protein n=2 Tax=Cochliobolus heterostrophus TaxID=5016 RepID=N4XQ37_COCH4
MIENKEKEEETGLKRNLIGNPNPDRTLLPLHSTSVLALLRDTPTLCKKRTPAPHLQTA